MAGNALSVLCKNKVRQVMKKMVMTCRQMMIMVRYYQYSPTCPT